MPVLVRERVGSSFLLKTLPGFTAQVAHDLNNHLATMLGKSELALMLDDPGRYRPVLGEILDAGQPARHIVADLQRIISWTRKTPEPVLLGEILSLVVRLTSRRCESLGLEICARPQSDVSQLADPATMALLVWKLVRVALEVPLEGEQGWTLSSESLPDARRVMLHAPSLRWPSSALESVRRAQLHGEQVAGSLGELLEGVQELDGSLSLEADRATLTVPC